MTPCLLPGLPAGWLEVTAGHWRAAERLAERAGLSPPAIDDAGLADRLDAELTAPLRLEAWPPPSSPRPVDGGWIHDEVVNEDREAFEALLSMWIETPGGGGPEEVVAAAQELRWPVTPYRPLPSAPPTTDGSTVPQSGRTASGPGTETKRTGTGGTGSGARRRPGRPAPPVVVDLSTHWAGPLAGALLAEAGARVIKLDPDCRPDGFRSRRALYAHLNGAKERVDLDLRATGDRAEFERLVTEADLIIESFSRRVLPNLGYGFDELRQINPEVSLLALRAFPAGSAEADWLAYGPGVHAASGLGWASPLSQDATAPGPAPMPALPPAPAPVAYPDLVAGAAAYAEATALLAGSAPSGRSEVTLAEAIAPLVTRAARAVGTLGPAGDTHG